MEDIIKENEPKQNPYAIRVTSNHKHNIDFGDALTLGAPDFYAYTPPTTPRSLSLLTLEKISSLTTQAIDPAFWVEHEQIEEMAKPDIETFINNIYEATNITSFHDNDIQLIQTCPMCIMSFTEADADPEITWFMHWLKTMCMPTNQKPIKHIIYLAPIYYILSCYRRASRTLGVHDYLAQSMSMDMNNFRRHVAYMSCVRDRIYEDKASDTRTIAGVIQHKAMLITRRMLFNVKEPRTAKDVASLMNIVRQATQLSKICNSSVETTLNNSSSLGLLIGKKRKKLD